MDRDIKNILNYFHEVADNPAEYVRKWKSKYNQPVVGYFCSYTPEEIILATGAIPYRIFGSGRQITHADAHLQAYSCSLVRGAMEDALGGHLDFLKGTVFPHTCDSIQRLSDMWRMNTGFDFHLDVVLPVKLDTGSARDYMVDVVKGFKRELGQAMGMDISEESIKAAAKVYNAIRGHIQALYTLRSANPGLISSGDLHAITKGHMMMDRNNVLELLTELRDKLSKANLPDVSEVKRIILSGGLCSMPDIYEIMEASGSVIVGDDLCTGARYAEGEIDLEGDIFESLADRYIERVVCPAKHSGLFSRGEHLVRLVKENRADGVIFLFLKFCDPHSFDYPYLKEMMEKEGIPSMLFELEDSSPSDGQFRTRCEAFIEML